MNISYKILKISLLFLYFSVKFSLIICLNTSSILLTNFKYLLIFKSFKKSEISFSDILFKIFLINSEPEPFSLSLYILKTFKNISLESISNTRLLNLSINLSIKSLLLLYKLPLNKEFINLFLI